MPLKLTTTTRYVLLVIVIVVSLFSFVFATMPTLIPAAIPRASDRSACTQFSASHTKTTAVLPPSSTSPHSSPGAPQVQSNPSRTTTMC